MRNFLVGLSAEQNKVEERISELRNRSIKIIQTKTLRKERAKENKHKSGSSKSCELTYMWSNIHVTRYQVV